MIKIKIKLLLLVVLLTTLNTSSLFSKSTNIPSDTIHRFILNYGKDSLLKLIDTAVFRGSKVIEAYESKLNNQSLSNEIKQVGKQFGLGYDTLPFLNAPQDFPILKMYNRYYGEDSTIKRLHFIMDSVVSTTEMYKLMNYYYDSIHASRIQKFILLYCDKLDVEDKVFDTLYNLKIKYPTKQKIETYFYFSEISRSCPGKYPLADSMKTALFLSLNKKLKLSEAMKDSSEVAVKNDLSFNLHYPFKFLAYALYANDISLKTNGADLIRLLSLQEPKTGAWKEYNFTSDIMYYPSTFYAIWALCELKQRVIAYK